MKKRKLIFILFLIISLLLSCVSVYAEKPVTDVTDTGTTEETEESDTLSEDQTDGLLRVCIDCDEKDAETITLDIENEEHVFYTNVVLSPDLDFTDSVTLPLGKYYIRSYEELYEIGDSICYIEDNLEVDLISATFTVHLQMYDASGLKTSETDENNPEEGRDSEAEDSPDAKKSTDAEKSTEAEEPAAEELSEFEELLASSAPDFSAVSETITDSSQSVLAENDGLEESEAEGSGASGFLVFLLNNAFYIALFLILIGILLVHRAREDKREIENMEVNWMDKKHIE